MKADLTAFSFEEFVAFFFSREVKTEDGEKITCEEKENWYWGIDDEYVPETFCNYYIRLFRNPEFLLERYSKIQLEEGFWAIQGPVLNCSLSNLLSNEDLSLDARVECIESMADLFWRLFSKESLDTSAGMWWDSLCYDWHCDNRNRANGGEDQLLQDAFFRTLSKILFFNSDICQGAALHGLGHLHHPDTPGLIGRYLEEHPKLSDEWKAYALAASKFEVM